MARKVASGVEGSRAGQHRQQDRVGDGVVVVATIQQA